MGHTFYSGLADLLECFVDLCIMFSLKRLFSFLANMGLSLQYRSKSLWGTSTSVQRVGI